jgi:hypothetical protein
MKSSEGGRLTVDGIDLAGEYAKFEANTPCAVHNIPDEGPSVSRVLGPASFTIVVTAPSDRLYALLDDSNAVHQVKVSTGGYAITHPTRFHKGWVGRDGVRKMFGSLAPDREREAKWVEEQPARASADRTEGK